MQNDTSTLKKELVTEFQKMGIPDRILAMAVAKTALENAVPDVEDDKIQRARLTVELLSLPDQVLLAL